MCFVAGGEACPGAGIAEKRPESRPVTLPTERLYTLTLRGKGLTVSSATSSRMSSLRP